MKKLLLIIGILCIAVCVFALIYAVLNCIGYYQLLDGSAELYARLHQRMILFFAVGTVLAVIGAVCLITRSKL